MSTSPRIGQRVRFTRHDHPNVPQGRGGMIDQLGSDNLFFVMTDCGGFFGWTSFDSWEATGEPDVVLNPEYVAMRPQTLCDDSSIKAFPVQIQYPTNSATLASLPMVWRELPILRS